RGALFAGIVFGDDRDQPPAATDDFRAAGLSHLLAVSGQNVAFVLLVARPVLLRLSLAPRFLLTVGVLGFFALITRFEPSVLRATAMAAVAAASPFVARPISRLRGVALAVGALVLLDPVLVRSVGFALSVLATSGIVLLAPPLLERLPGPHWVALPMAVTLAAQVAVAPLLLAVFGRGARAARARARPAGGGVRPWGLGAGPAAGVLGPGPAQLLHLPTGLLLAWLDRVAESASSVPVGELGLPHLLALAFLAGA